MYNDEAYVGRMLKIMFLRRNKNKYTEIKDAIASGDVISAHRLVHSLKGNSGQIGEFKLQAAASEVEELLAAGSAVPKESAEALEAELAQVLGKLSPLTDEIYELAALKPEEIRELYENLKVMLENINPECLDLLGILNTVPGTEQLANQIEDFDLDSALETLNKLMKEQGEPSG